jgi:hypothetical protein
MRVGYHKRLSAFVSAQEVEAVSKLLDCTKYGNIAGVR